MKQGVITKAQKMRLAWKGQVDAGPRPKLKQRKIRLGVFAVPHAFIAHEYRSQLVANRTYF
jgi:hypothetical protein